MQLRKGSKLGPYEIQESVGRGGMGEVYRAVDVRLNRTVAVKVLSPLGGEYEELRQRFEREAHAISSLSHPNICVLYDVGRQDETDYLVMEYVEGESLAQRLTRGPLPIALALDYARQMAEALTAAHRQGIIHRDLKPGNVMITKSGVKLLDFGLAKMRAAESAAVELTALPTERMSLTGKGSILGTFQYMAPEQLEGKEADARTDIFAFGLVIYEMVTGRRAFDGKSQASLIAKILETDPTPITTTQPLAPAGLDRLVKNCLAKDPEKRWQTAHDVLLELQGIAEGSSQPGVPVPTTRGRKTRTTRAVAILSIIVLCACVLVVLLALPYFSSASVPSKLLRLSIDTPKDFVLDNNDGPILSPDGRTVTFVALTPGGRTSLWVRRLDSATPQLIPGTEGGWRPFWSPDSRSIAFYSDDDLRLKRVDVESGMVRIICPFVSTPALGGTWNKDGTIIFSRAFGEPLFQVPANGGEPKQLTALDRSRGESLHGMPQFLPDGRHFLFEISSRPPESSGMYVASLDSPGDRKRVLDQITNASYHAPGYLLFARQSAVVAQAFDTDNLTTRGEVFQIVDKAAIFPITGWALFSASDDGMLAYFPAYETNTQLTWYDRRGRQVGVVGKPRAYGQITLSPDQKRVAVELPDAKGNNDIWTIELAREVATRLTFDPAADWDPVWSPDGKAIVFDSESKDTGVKDLFVVKLTGDSRATPLLQSKITKMSESWTRDGFILFHSGDRSGRVVWKVPAAGGKPQQVLKTGYTLDEAQISPDGHWMAYMSDESGQNEVYLAPFDRSGERIQVSSTGGGEPKWRADGRELFYASLDATLMAVEVNTAGELKVGIPTALFKAPVMRPDFDDYAVTADGQRFLVKVPVDNLNGKIQLVINWNAGLR